jgi:hypothetical protein
MFETSAPKGFSPNQIDERFDWGIFAVDTPWFDTSQTQTVTMEDSDFNSPINMAMWDYEASDWIGYITREVASTTMKFNETAEQSILPRQILFNRGFLELLPVSSRLDDGDIISCVQQNGLTSIGSLRWKRVLVLNSSETTTFGSHTITEYLETIHAQFEGRKFVYQLNYEHKESCKGRCHTIGEWRD